MILTGFIGFLDPPKESAAMAIKRMNEAGIRVIVLTGDNAEVTNCICKKVGIKTSKIVLGSDIDKLPDNGVIRLLKRKHNVFAKLSPIQKARIIRLLKTSGNVVGYMGDGINDTPSLTNSDVGVSVDTAVDIAKETADIILLEKDLNVLLDGVTEGRKTFSNLLKYIKLAVSFNFGEVISVLIASILLPFFPITPIQLLVQSLLYDIGQLTLPFDNVDSDALKKPRKWSTSLPGISLEESDKMGHRAEELLLSIPEIQTVARKTGRAELDEHALGVNVSEIEAPFELKERSRSELVAEVREKLGRAGHLKVRQEGHTGMEAGPVLTFFLADGHDHRHHAAGNVR